jgi:hypothetical protein
VSGNAVTGVSGTGSNPFLSYSTTVSTASGLDGAQSYGTGYGVSNLLIANPNFNFVGPSNTSVVSAVAIISSISTILNPLNAFSSISYSNVINNSNVVASTNAQFMQMVGLVYDGAIRYGRILPLTSSVTTTFSL